MMSDHAVRELRRIFNIINMRLIHTAIKDVVLLEPQLYTDSRGYFFESFSQEEFGGLVGKVNFVQDNESKSSYGVVRGLHYQLPPYTQAKLLRVIKGRIWDVVVDLRGRAATFGKHVAVELTEENKLQLFVPKGFAHGFAVLSEEAIVQYKCDNYYVPESEGGVCYDDPELNIDWRIPREEMILSHKDLKYPGLKDACIFDL